MCPAIMPAARGSIFRTFREGDVREPCDDGRAVIRALQQGGLVGCFLLLGATVTAQQDAKQSGPAKSGPAKSGAAGQDGTATAKQEQKQEPETAEPVADGPGKGSFPAVDIAGRIREVETPSAGAPPRRERHLVRAKDEVVLRYLRTAESDAIADPLPAGTLLWRLGEESYGYARVALPGGFEGFVHRGFLAINEEGWGTTTGTRVSFRHRPKTSEPPLHIMTTLGMRLPVLGLEGDWYRVLSNDDVTAWAPVASLEEIAIVGDDKGYLEQIQDAAVRKSYEEQVAERRKPWLARRDELAEMAKKRQSVAALGVALDELRKQYDAEMAKGDILQEDLDPLLKLIDALQAKAATFGAEGGAVAPRIDAFRGEVQKRRTLQEARSFLIEAKAKEAAANKKEVGEKEAPPVAGKEGAPRPEYDCVGWLEFRPGIDDYSAYRLTKGGRLLYYVTCSSGRYDLRDFVGHEVGVRGRVDRPQAADVRVIDLKRLVILSRRK